MKYIVLLVVVVLSVLGAVKLFSSGQQEISSGGVPDTQHDNQLMIAPLPNEGQSFVTMRGYVLPIRPDGEPFPVEKSDEQWQQQLSTLEFRVLRHEATEPAFDNQYDGEERTGTYYSRATGQPLFSSKHKYDSGTGWPSFDRPIDPAAVRYRIDRSLFGERIEVIDSSSGSHLGHVFPDGPPTTGLRYCMNSAAMIFVPQGEDPPELVQEYARRYLR